MQTHSCKRCVHEVPVATSLEACVLEVHEHHITSGCCHTDMVLL